jgi:hypothetical protein
MVTAIVELWVTDPEVPMTLMLPSPVMAPAPFVKVKVEEPLPGEARVVGLNVAEMPVGN